MMVREDGRPAHTRFIRWANVFNLDQTEGMQAPAITATQSVTQPHEKAAAIEGMPLTWAREHGIDTRLPGFAHHDQDGDGVSTLMEWKHGTRPADRLSRPHRQSLSL